MRPVASPASIPPGDASPARSNAEANSPGANRPAKCAAKQLQEYASAVRAVYGELADGCEQLNASPAMARVPGQKKDSSAPSLPARSSASSTNGFSTDPGGAGALAARSAR